MANIKIKIGSCKYQSLQVIEEMDYIENLSIFSEYTTREKVRIIKGLITDGVAYYDSLEVRLLEVEEYDFFITTLFVYTRDLRENVVREKLGSDAYNSLYELEILLDKEIKSSKCLRG